MLFCELDKGWKSEGLCLLTTVGVVGLDHWESHCRISKVLQILILILIQPSQILIQPSPPAISGVCKTVLRFNNSLERLGEVRIAVIFMVCVCHREGCRCSQQREELQRGGSRTQELGRPVVLSQRGYVDRAYFSQHGVSTHVLRQQGRLPGL